MNKKRVLFIGLDAGDRELIEGWCQEGLLPNIARMRTRGTWAPMRTTAETLHVSAWPCVFTGAEPDEHGLYHAYVMNPGHQSPVRPRPDQSPVPFLWQLLSDRGKRCVIMDAFMTCPLQNFNGAQIVEWGTWSWFSPPTILPASLKQEMQRKFGAYPAEDHSKVGMNPLSDHEGFRRRLVAAIEKKTQVVRWLMDREAWDLFLVVFGEAHPAGHYFWHLHDPSYITHPEAGAGSLRSALLDVYVALDQAIGDLLQAVGDDTTVFLVSGDGMGPNYSGSHILGDLLGRMGLLNGPSDVAPESARQTPMVKADVLSILRGMIPKPVRTVISKTLLPRHVNERLSLRWKTANVSWERTRAFLIENANEGYIRINLHGREPQGTVNPGKEYQELCEELRKTIASSVNPNNDRPAAQAVLKTDDIYSGPCRSHLPDLIVNWSDNAQITTRLLTENYGLASSEAPGCALPPYYSGNHRANAFTLAVGPEVAPGRVLEGAHILDLAPTLLSHFGMEPSRYMTGKSLDELRGSDAVQAT